MSSMYDYVGAKALITAAYVTSKSGSVRDVSSLDYYSIVRYILEEELGVGELEDLIKEIQFDIDKEEGMHEEALTMNEMVEQEPAVDDEWAAFDDMLAQQDLGDVDPSTYQEQDEGGCEGGGCII